MSSSKVLRKYETLYSRPTSRRNGRFGAIQVLRNAVGGQLSQKKTLRRCKVQGVGGGQIPRKKRYITLEWPLNTNPTNKTISMEQLIARLMPVPCSRIW